MKLKSLGYQTDLIFPGFEGEVTDCGSYIRVRTPQNPGFWWGNFLLFEGPPKAGDFERWTELFRKEIGQPPATEHMVFAWDISQEKAVTHDFLEAGFKLEQSVVMTAESVIKPANYNAQVQIRSLEKDEDFSELLELEILVDKEFGFGGSDHRLFLKRKIDRYRKMIDAGLGKWFAAYLDGKMVSYMGLFWQGRLARYQNVGTHPDYRRQGIAGTLVHYVGNYGLENIGVDYLVMIADQNYFAKDIYASVGFRETEYLEALELPPKT
ncbi:MAG: GNAT family N-acetyltransferase [Trueperaceae bacterium]|nr:GNAT family N-acetyltransferase [Trueperaceae bacterium]